MDGAVFLPGSRAMIRNTGTEQIITGHFQTSIATTKDFEEQPL